MDKNIKKTSKIQEIIFIIFTVHCISLITRIIQITKLENANIKFQNNYSSSHRACSPRKERLYLQKRTTVSAEKNDCICSVTCTRTEKNDCICSVTCTRTLFELSLSYAMSSEFNIDQVALTTPAKKQNVEVKFEAKMEKQQRVIKDIREADEDSMEKILNTARGISTALNTTYTLSTNTTILLSEFYKIPDDLSEELLYPEQDVEYTKVYSEQLKERNDQVRISFWETKEKLDDLVSSFLQYNDGESETISVTQYYIDEGLTGNDDMDNVCIGRGGDGSGGGGHPPPPTTALPIQIDCDPFDQIVCFLEQLAITNEFIKMDKDMAREQNSITTSF